LSLCIIASAKAAAADDAAGNDLARVLRWGAGYNGEDEPLTLLRDVIDAEEIKLDRSVSVTSVCYFSFMW